MFNYLKHSLLLRAGLAMGLITALALFSMGSAVYVTRSVKGEASAVNLAGSLRMQSYRILALLERNDASDPDFVRELTSLADEFEARINSRVLSKVVHTANRSSLYEAYSKIINRWDTAVHPLIAEYIRLAQSSTYSQDPSTAIRQINIAYRYSVRGFVNDINSLVRLLEEDAESRIHMLGLLQGVSFMLTLLIAVITLYLLYTDILSPVHDLLKCAERTGSGDFSARVGNTGSDELGILGQAFNTMAADISAMYDQLEHRVNEKTKELTDKNRFLELLYNASHNLTKAATSKTTYQDLLKEIADIVDCEGICLCMLNEDKNQAITIAATGATPPMCNDRRCSLCIANGSTRQISSIAHGGSNNVLSIPIRDPENQYGVFLVEQKKGRSFDPWQIQVLKTLAKHIGISIGVTRSVIQDRRLALLDERSVIARELHDSLAQSLSYLKIQVTRLTILRNEDPASETVDDALNELKEGLDVAYRQLRELLTTFRLQMDGQGLAAALSKTVTNFNIRSDIEISLHNELTNFPFSVNEEIHILHIAREALTNIIYHSKATRADIYLLSSNNNGVLMQIDDNGVGIPDKAERTHHYGLAIMHERAASLNANLQIKPRTEGGTRVTLTFQPSNRQQSYAELNVEI